MSYQSCDLVKSYKLNARPACYLSLVNPLIIQLLLKCKRGVGEIKTEKYPEIKRVQVEKKEERFTLSMAHLINSLR